jgi:optic atrophy protein 1
LINFSEKLNVKKTDPVKRRMVLVDLPGLICTETAGIRPGTATEILNLAREQMDFPNAIILCVQDGSVDAERSQVTNYVREADPTGERTLLVLTKVDKAVADPVRLKQILDGKLFPLRALGYFAVVTGNENKDASIAEIRNHENQFFQRSPLLNSGILQPDQLGTNNLCDAVSKLFWCIVKNSLSGELQKLKEQLFILESEWKAQVKSLSRAYLQ